MAVLMSYHKLVEKDSHHVSYCWKLSILIVLIVAIGSSLVISFSLQHLWETFSANCFVGANISFMAVPKTIVKPPSPPVSSSEALNKTTLKERYLLEKLLRSMPEDEKYAISEYESNWNNSNFCEYLIYTPLFHALIGVIWLAIFVTHGHGGEGVGSIIARPWRIVLPSLLFFVVCSISAVVCASLTLGGMAAFCEQFDKIDSSGEIGCSRMITYFSMHEEAHELVLPDKNYYLVVSFPWIWALSYLCGVLILLLRIVLVVDFKLIRVVVSTVEKETESVGDQQSAEIVDESKFDNEPVQAESRI